ncbi:hypothetical protein NIES267_63820 [Calothrix parasitica NIES-267]|uniref:Uncharacterized protein n=1 Tax=Calothrix parasitica NIES-267 TaxID=1973488 RepID=A0A1Z4M0C7_9CYAN|nr:hypothetical protein NIES267_63820 [Calothrix parasitica NIES-267]
MHLLLKLSWELNQNQFRLRKSMNINDLETCEIVEFDNQIIGGKPYTFVKGSVKVEPGNGFANVFSGAKGDYTSTGASSGVSVSSNNAVGYYVGHALATEGRKVSYKIDYGTDYAADYGHKKY